METPNLKYIQKLSNGDSSFEQEMIAIIKAEYPEEIAVYFKNISSENYTLAAENVHKIKHKISIFGLESSYKIAADFENNLKEGKLFLQKEFEEILTNITKFIKHI